MYSCSRLPSRQYLSHSVQMIDSGSVYGDRRGYITEQQRRNAGGDSRASARQAVLHGKRRQRVAPRSLQGLQIRFGVGLASFNIVSTNDDVHQILQTDDAQPSSCQM